MKTVKVFLFIFISIFLFSCSNAATNDKNLSIKDRAGNDIVLPKKIESIACLSPSVTDVILALGLADRIIAFDSTSKEILQTNNIDVSNIAVFDMLNPDSEKMIAMKPDIVFVNTFSVFSGKNSLDSIKASDICIVVIPNSDTIKSIEDDITSKELVKKIELLRGSLGIIIDDGNHAWGVQRTLFETYFPLLNSGGYFVVEDVRCDVNGDYQYDRPKNFVYDRMSFTEYTKYMLELLRYPYIYRTDWIEAYLTTLPGNMKDIILEVENIFYIPGAIIISKC